MSQQTEQEIALAKIRVRIDALDRQIHQLLNERAQCAQEVAEVKAQFEQDEVVFYRPEREAQVLRGAMERNEGPLPDAEIARLFREVMSSCLALEQPLRVVFPGSLCSKSHQASMKQFGQSAEFVPVDSIEAIFSEVAEGSAHYGIVPIEGVDPRLSEAAVSALAKFDLALCGEVSELGSRYLVVGDQLVGPSGEDKTALLVELRGSVEQLDEIFQQAGVHPTAIVENAADDVCQVYIDFIGHCNSDAVQQLCVTVEQTVLRCKNLGSFPIAVL
jgi:chorismate mutase-like protein